MKPSPSFDPSANPHPEQLNGSSAPASHADKPPRPAAERDAKGRFTPGNPGGPGNPFARQVAKLRSALVNRVTEADMDRIAEDLIVKARLGDLAAIKLLFLYVLGKPAATVNPDTVAIEEWQQTIRPIPQIMQELPVSMMTIPVETLNGMVRIMQPFVQRKLAETVAKPCKASESGPTPSEKKSERLDNHADKPAFEPATPSANGGNGRKEKDGEPSPNGSCGRAKPLPSWLAKIAAKAQPSPASPRKGHRKGR